MMGWLIWRAWIGLGFGVSRKLGYVKGYLDLFMRLCFNFCPIFFSFGSCSCLCCGVSDLVVMGIDLIQTGWYML
ncbi:Os03g0857000 [Oryza sativa Japonica Group]|uniref:Os03g0857000 protein n=2 Tax=Oryza sativa TaxID=4530 RepID=A0A0P0W5Q7_ORYSJ|nr:hypothetical protein OsI_14404 [Oryza sativa Indica Group]KAB8094556.1 hypothetical protein EE612_021757 [Oryza sativa]BAS87452.1 Os03g0857000 [Oryza sativa Japonica Group]